MLEEKQFVGKLKPTVMNGVNGISDRLLRETTTEKYITT